MKTPEIREAPVPVRYRWETILGLGSWFRAEDIPHSTIFEVVERNIRSRLVPSSHVELSNGQTIIVRAKP